MPSEGAPPPDRLDDGTHADILRRIIADKLDKIAPAARPRCFLLGGQPGAGKSGLREPIMQALGEGNVLVIDPDDLRAYHPRYVQFVKENAETAASRSHPDASAWAAELRAAALARSVNVLLDGTLGWADSAVETADEATAAGYGVELHVVAVPLDMSRLGVRARLEANHEAAATHTGSEATRPLPRSVPDTIQTSAYEGLPKSVERLTGEGRVSRVRVSNRGGEVLADMAGRVKIQQAAMVERNPFAGALEDERNRPWRVDEIESYTEQSQMVLAQMRARADRAGPEAHEHLPGEIAAVEAQCSATLNRRLDEAQRAWVRNTLHEEV